MAVLTTTDLLAEVRRLAMLPASSTTAGTDTDILAAADGEMQTRLVPLLLRVNEDYLVRKVTFPVFAGSAEYPVWPSAIGARIRSLDILNGGLRYHLPRLKPESRERYSSAMTGLPMGFYLDAAQIVLLPTPSFSGTLEQHIYVRPGKLVPTTSCRQVTGANENTNYLGAASTGRVKLTFATGIDFGGDELDAAANWSQTNLVALGDSYSSAGGVVSVIDMPMTGMLGIGLLSESRFLNGDWVCRSGQSCVPCIPTELFPVLAQRTANRMLRSLGYLSEAGAGEKVADEMERAAIDILTPRTDGNPKRLSGGALGLIGRGSGGLWRY